MPKLHLKATNLADKDWGSSDTSDPYFAIYAKGKKVGKSEVLENTVNPEWAAVEFELPE